MIKQIVKRELTSWFATPAVWLYFAIGLLAIIFPVFWIDRFFQRNIADLQPLFSWLPITLMFFTTAATMRAWSEEIRSGTIEKLLALPVSAYQLVLAKLITVLVLVALLLGLTLPFTFIVGVLGPVDWGPVIGSYLAAFFLVFMYAAIGLFVSVRSDNQIISLIVTILVISCFHLVGSAFISGLFDAPWSQLLQYFGSGSRFESIARGVIDFRDIYYYLSLGLVFILLNIHSIATLASKGHKPSAATKRQQLFTVLLMLNILAVNFWLSSYPKARVDVTDDQKFSLSDVTLNYLTQVREPVNIKLYFSQRTHPLLQTLMPQVRDLLKEYVAFGQNNINFDMVDPSADTQIADELSANYSIHPITFRSSDRHQSAVTNAYFHIVLSYGDQTEVIDFRELIEVEQRPSTGPQLTLSSPEYVVTRAMQNLLKNWRSGQDVYARLAAPLAFTVYMSEPDESKAYIRTEIEQALATLQAESKETIAIQWQNPDKNQALAQNLLEQGVQPLQFSLASKPFWLVIIAKIGGRDRLFMPLPNVINAERIAGTIRNALNRFVQKGQQTLAIAIPEDNRSEDTKRRQLPFVYTYSEALVNLSRRFKLLPANLAQGNVPEQAQMMLVLAPKRLSAKAVYQLDQFLMQGGTLVIALSPFEIGFNPAMNATATPTGLEEWLAHFGVRAEPQMLFDREQNGMLALPTNRVLGGITVPSVSLVRYPYLLQIDKQGIADPTVLGKLANLTVPWASPLTIDEAKSATVTWTPLLQASRSAETTVPDNLLPDNQGLLETATTASDDAAILAAVAQGQFVSYFADRANPWLVEDTRDDTDTTTAEDADRASLPPDETTRQRFSAKLKHSNQGGRLLVIASDTFAADVFVQLASGASGNNYEESLHWLENIVDWGLGDENLIKIRTSSHLARVLDPLTAQQANVWEWLIYILSALILVFYGLCAWLISRQQRREYFQQFQLDKVAA